MVRTFMSSVYPTIFYLTSGKIWTSSKEFKKKIVLHGSISSKFISRIHYSALSMIHY